MPIVNRVYFGQHVIGGVYPLSDPLVAGKTRQLDAKIDQGLQDMETKFLLCDNTQHNCSEKKRLLVS